ncbi:MAG TPA: hypothetical protein VH593_27790 [Ktedonobacteraceae bacterium]|jgi:hypothetical protein
MGMEKLIGFPHLASFGLLALPSSIPTPPANKPRSHSPPFASTALSQPLSTSVDQREEIRSPPLRQF